MRMKTVKSIISLLAVLIFCISLTACAGKSDPKSSASVYDISSRKDYLTFRSAERDCTYFIHPDGSTSSVPSEYAFITDIADNGAAVVFGSDHLYLLKDGNNTLVYSGPQNSNCVLCTSGRKLIYQNNSTMVSYDVESGESSEICEIDEYGPYIDYVSYDGNVICFSNDTVSIGEEEPDACYNFAKWAGASDSGKRIYYNSSYNVMDYGGIVERYPGTDFHDFGVLKSTKVKNGNFPRATLLYERAASPVSITAHNADFSKILFYFEGDTYYYDAKNKRKSAVVSGLMLVPVEETSDDKIYDTGSGQHSSGQYFNFSERFESYWTMNDVVSSLEDHAPAHSVSSIKGHIFCAFDEGFSASLVYLDENLEIQTIVDHIMTAPIVAGDGKYIWTTSGDTVYRIDLTGGKPEVFEKEVDGLSRYYSYEFPFTSYDYVSLPLAVAEDGKTCCCIGHTYLDEDLGNEGLIAGTLYYVDPESENDAADIAMGVTSCKAGEAGDTFYYVHDFESSNSGSLYLLGASGDISLISDNVDTYYVANSRLYFVRHESTGENDWQNNVYEYKNRELQLIIEDVQG